jgi:hypothetical protein
LHENYSHHILKVDLSEGNKIAHILFVALSICRVHITSAFLLLLFLVSASRVVFAAENPISYRVTGQLRVNAIDEVAANRGEFEYESTAWEYSFTVSVSGDAWHIQANPTLQPPLDDDLGLPQGYKQTPLGWNLIAASNGSEFSKVKNGPRSTPEAVYQVQRGAGSAPFGVEREIAALWYAYASHSNLSGGDQGWLVPMERLPLDIFAATTNRVNGHFVLLGKHPGLPSNVTTFGYAHEIGDGRLGYLNAELKFTNTVFTVTATTNIGALTLPLEAKLHYYAVVNSGGKAESKPSYEIVIETLSITPSAILPQYPPELSGGFVISDYRYINKNGNGIATVVTKNAWPAESLIRSESAGHVGRALRDSEPKNIRFIMLVLLTVPVIFAIVKLLLNRKRKENQ